MVKARSDLANRYNLKLKLVEAEAEGRTTALRSRLDEAEQHEKADAAALVSIDTSILHHAFISIFIALWAVITHYFTILMPTLSYFTRFT